MASTYGVPTTECHDVAIVETHAIENFTKVLRSLKSSAPKMHRSERTDVYQIRSLVAVPAMHPEACRAPGRAIHLSTPAHHNKLIH